MHSSKLTPKNVEKNFRSISLLLITNSDVFKGISSLVEGLLKRLQFFIFNDNVLSLNQWLTLTNSVFIVWKTVLTSLW